MEPIEIVITFSDGSKTTIKNTRHVDAVEMLNDLGPYQCSDRAMTNVELVYYCSKWIGFEF